MLLIHENNKNTINQIYTISGHVHPGYRLKGKAKQSINLPCFYVGKKNLILPAFGELTGLYAIKKENQEDVIVLCVDGVVASI